MDTEWPVFPSNRPWMRAQRLAENSALSPWRVSFFYFCFFFSHSLFSPFSLCCLTVSVLITPNTDHSRLISQSPLNSPTDLLPVMFKHIQIVTLSIMLNNLTKKKNIVSQKWCQGDTFTAEWKDCPDEKYLLYSQTVITPSIWSSPRVLRTADEGVHLFPWQLPRLTFNRAASELKVRPGVY